MIITHHGIDSFKVSFGDITVSVNPISKDSSFKNTRFGADIVLISSNDPEHNGYQNNSRQDKEPFVISGPGEYEVSGIFVKGFLSKTNYGGKEGVNSVYSISMEGMNLVFLGALDENTLNPEVKKATENCDILFVPIGGEGVLDASTAQKIAVQFEPRIIIPSHFSNKDKGVLEKFKKESGSEKVDLVEKLTIKKKDIENMEGEVIILDPQN